MKNYQATECHSQKARVTAIKTNAILKYILCPFKVAGISLYLFCTKHNYVLIRLLNCEYLKIDI